MATSNDIASMQFILPAVSKETFRAHLDNIKLWALNNPDKKVFVWFDSLADNIDAKFDSFFRGLQTNPLTTREEALNNFRNFLENTGFEYLEKLGTKTFGPILDKYRQAMDKFDVDKLAADDLDYFFARKQLEEIFKDVNERMFKESLRVNNRVGGIKELFELDDNDSTKATINDMRDYVHQTSPNGIDPGNIEFHDLYDYHFENLNIETDLYSLYLYEILCNRDMTVAQNLFTYMVANFQRDSLVMPSNIVPELNDELSKYSKNDAIKLIRLKIQGRDINDLSADEILSLNLESGGKLHELIKKVHKMQNDEFFVPIKRSNRSDVFASINETEVIVTGLLFPQDAHAYHDVRHCLEDVYKKRFNQIQFFPADAVQRYFYDKIESMHIDKDDVKSAKEKCVRLVDKFHEDFIASVGQKTVEANRHDVSKYSKYKKHITEFCSTQFWSDAGAPLKELNGIDVSSASESFFEKPEQIFIQNLHEERMDSDFDLDIFANIHESGTEHFEFIKYPRYSKKVMLFVFDPKESNRLMFKETGITTSDGTRFLEKNDIGEHIRMVSERGGKIRIQLIGHSYANYKKKTTNFNVADVEQKVVGLNVEQLSTMFRGFHDDWMRGVNIDRLVFVACDLANFRGQPKTSELTHLPKNTFLEEFIDNFKANEVNVKEITAYDSTLVVDPRTGRLDKLSTHPESTINGMRLSPQEIRKLVINSEERTENGYKCTAVERDTDVSSEQILEDKFTLSSNVFDHSSTMNYPEVLEVPKNAENILNEFAKAAHNEGHSILQADALALVACAQDRPGNTLITDVHPQRIEALRLLLRIASVYDNYQSWISEVGRNFPDAFEFIKSKISDESFKTLVDNVASGKISFAKYGLSEPNDYKNIQNYLAIETGNTTVAALHVGNQESDISRQVITREMAMANSQEDENFIGERKEILEKRNSALENFQENVKKLMQDDTVLVRTDYDDNMQTLDKSRMHEWPIRSHIEREPLELMAIDANHAEIFSEAYSVANELQHVFQHEINSHPTELTPNHVPLFDTLETVNEGDDRYYRLSFIDSTNMEHPPVTIATKETIYERVKTFVKKVSIDHVNTAGSTALNVYFGVKAICHWVENGFTPDLQGTANKSLATAIEVHFYVNTEQQIQGLAEVAYLGGKLAVTAGMKSALLVRTLKPFVKMSLDLLKISSTGRVLLSFGKMAGKALPVIGLLINMADFGLNVYELTQNDDPAQRPILITNAVFSAAGLLVAVSGIVAAIVGATALGGPLALVGIAIAVIAIPIAYLVEKLTERVEGAKHLGMFVKSIVDEIKRGAYKKVDNKDDKFLLAPSFVAVDQLILSTSEVIVQYGVNNYYPSSIQSNYFSHWYHPEGDAKHGDNLDQAKISINDTIRTVLLPHVPGYTFKIDNKSVVPFVQYRHDAEFDWAKDLQHKDSGFDFLGGSTIKTGYHLEYEDTDINIVIQESCWRLIFPWGDKAHATEDKDKKSIQDSNKQTAEHLERINYYIRAEGGGRQSILLPGIECPLSLGFNTTRSDVTWFFDFIEQGVSNKNIEATNDRIKIGDRQFIHFDEKTPSKIYVGVPNYEDSEYNGMAYLDVLANRYIYATNVNVGELRKAIFLFATKEYGYYLKTGKSDSENWLWCANIETKKIVLAQKGVRSCQQQGEAAVIIDYLGVIYHTTKDLKTEKMVSQVFGVNEEWFNQKQNAVKSLEDFNTLLKDNPNHSQIISLALPYNTSDGSNLNANILYYPGKGKYFILNAHYTAPATRTRFVKFDNQFKNAYYYAAGEETLIAVKGLDLKETASKLQVVRGKTYVIADETNEILLRRVLNASATDAEVKVELIYGLVALFDRDENGHKKLNIQKLVIGSEYVTGREMKTESVLERAVEEFGRESLQIPRYRKIHPSDAEISQIEFLPIELGGKTVAYYEKLFGRTLIREILPDATFFRPFGSDDVYMYSILDGQKLYQSQWTPYFNEYPLYLKKLKVKRLFEAEVLEVFDNTLFVKKVLIEKGFADTLKTISKLPQIQVIWLESQSFNLDLNGLERVTISSIDLSKCNEVADILLHVDTLDGLYLERQNFDLCLHNPKKNFAFVFSGVFKPKVRTLFNGVTLASRNTYTLTSLIDEYQRKTQPLYIADRVFAKKIRLVDLFKPTDNGGKDEKPEQKNEYDEIINLIKNRFGVKSLRNLGLVNEKEENVLAFVVASRNPIVIEDSFRMIENHFGKETLEKLMLKFYNSKENILKRLFNREGIDSIKALTRAVENSLGKDARNKLLREVENAADAYIRELYTVQQSPTPEDGNAMEKDPLNELKIQIQKSFDAILILVHQALEK